MDNGLWIGALSAFSALAGAGLAQWGALRAAALHSRHQADRDTLQRSQALLDRQTEVSARKREEFLGLVLLAESLMIGRLNQFLKGSPVSDTQTPASAARQAYAVALLYLADMPQLAKAFYGTTAELQLVFEGGDKSSLSERTSAWRKSILDIEIALAAQSHSSLA